MGQLYGQLKDTDGTTKWKPIEAVLNNDGTYSIRVDTELVLDGANISIGNIKVGSVNQSSATLRYIKVEDDGTIVSISTPLDLYEVADVDTNPSFPKYYGYTDRDENWYILEEDKPGSNDGSFRYVKGSGSYSTAWTNRATQTYDFYHNVF